MAENHKTQAFEEAIAKLGASTSGSSREAGLQKLGLAIMVVASVAGFVTYFASRGLSDSRDLLSTLVLTGALLSMVIVGACIFLYYALTRFMRFWLLRVLYERASLDQETS